MRCLYKFNFKIKLIIFIFTDPSYAGLMKAISEDPMPRHWEDVADVETFDKIAKSTFNKVHILF